MREYISCISKKETLYGALKYMWIEVPEKYDNINFESLLNFIDIHSLSYQKNRPYANAYQRIKEVSNHLYGVGRGSMPTLKTSKREIRTILHSVVSKVNGRNYIKIPYKVAYIFKAIISIVNDILKENKIDKLPDELEEIFNLTYGIAFYEYHIFAYDSCYDRIRMHSYEDDGYTLKRKLNQDFHSINSVFNIKIK